MRSKEKTSEAFWRDLNWARRNHTKLLEKYVDMWVAVVDKKVIAFGRNLGKVEEEARRKSKRDDFPVMFVECGEHIYGLQGKLIF
ncbi:MAG: DUF5678 domain-containing protein [Candidatus Thermoplasmatota archaeon]|nr:DUF5678 domain-containing protein [Candidatus Thermoplasmatota archaeon]MDI6856081.1 DUF5678 domain-containing protein [Candidatus Thermoplasmatota archaeon]